MAESSIEKLQVYHVSLERKIEAEGRCLIPDQMRISELKREKLRVKDELNRLKGLDRQD